MTVIKRAGSTKYGNATWLCKCECGNEKVVVSGLLVKGQATSCGCYRNSFHVKHHSYRTRLYKIWEHMKYRCNNPNCSSYADYGGRGIKVCDEWQDYIPFSEWALASGYEDSLTIDRVDVDGNYEPSNCRWATRKEQQNNLRCTIFVEYNGEKKSLSEWSEITGITKQALAYRIKAGWDLDKVFSKGGRQIDSNK